MGYPQRNHSENVDGQKGGMHRLDYIACSVGCGIAKLSAYTDDKLGLTRFCEGHKAARVDITITIDQSQKRQLRKVRIDQANIKDPQLQENQGGTRSR